MYTFWNLKLNNVADDKSEFILAIVISPPKTCPHFLSQKMIYSGKVDKLMRMIHSNLGVIDRGLVIMLIANNIMK